MKSCENPHNSTIRNGEINYSANITEYYAASNDSDGENFYTAWKSKIQNYITENPTLYTHTR